MTNEYWLPVVGYEGLYEVSDQGRVRTLKTGVLKKPSPLPRGYLCVWLYPGNKNCLVSRLVLQAFAGEPPSAQHQAAHGDGDPANNHLNNLRWATPKENDADKTAHGTRMVRVGVAVSRAVLNHVDVERIRDLSAAGCPQRVISTWISTCLSNVSVVAQRKTWRHVR